MVLGSDILDKDLNALFEDSNHTIGEALALEVLRDNLPDVFADSSANEQIAKEITDYASTEAFINGMAVYCDIAEQHLQPLRLLWLLTKHLSYIQSERLKSAWNATEYSKIISSIYHFPWMDGPKGQLASAKAAKAQAKAAKSAANATKASAEASMSAAKAQFAAASAALIDAENNLIAVKGAVPGAVKSIVTLRNSVKA